MITGLLEQQTHVKKVSRVDGWFQLNASNKSLLSLLSGGELLSVC